MKEKRMLENIGQVKEQFIEEAAPKGLLEEQPPAKQKKAVSYTWLKWAALAACLCVVVGICVKTALPMFETVDDAATNDTNTSITTVDNNLITEDTITLQATAESGIVSFPDWGLSLSVKDVSATGLTLVVAQSGGEPTGTLETGEPYRIITLVECKDIFDKNRNKIIGFIVLKDNVRKNAKEMFDYLKSQDVNIKIISGDN